MPLCQPAPLLGATLFWREIRRSSVLLLLKLKKPGGIYWLSDKYKILLAHNQYVIAQAKTRREIEELWILCSDYAELLAGDSRLVLFFTSLWKESAAEAALKQLKINELLIGEEKLDSINTISLSNGKKRYRSLSLPYIKTPRDNKSARVKHKQQALNKQKELLSPHYHRKIKPFIIFDSYPEHVHVYNEDSHVSDIEIPLSEPTSSSEIDNFIETRLQFPHNLYARKLLEMIDININDSLLRTPKLLRALHSFDRNKIEESLEAKNEYERTIYIHEIKEEEEEGDVELLTGIPKELLLSFEKGDILLGYFECNTGNTHLTLAQNHYGEFGLFFNDGFTSQIQFDVSKYIESKLLNKKKRKKEIDGILLRSYIWKKGYWGPWKDWKLRWFVLDSRRLRIYYYSSPEDEKTHNSRGMINIRDITTIHESFYPGSRRKKGYWPFELHTADREWLLQANSEEEMNNWIEKINLLALHNDHRLSKTEMKFDPLALKGGTNTPGLQSLSPNVGGSEAANEPNAGPAIADDNFDTFGAPDGEEIVNKKTILHEIDRWLGYYGPPSLEYIYVEPYLNYVNGSIQLTANPYGHAVVRYTLPDTGEQIVMNIVGLENQEMVNFLPPEDFFFSTNFDIKTGNEQGGIYNRTFAAIRIQRLPPERILAMHQYFLDLHDRSHKSKAIYNIAIGPILNRLGKISYGNCAYFTSEGLRHAGILPFKGIGSIIPKAIWIDIYEKFKAECQQSELSNNVSVVYYKRIPHAKRFYGLDANFSGWGRPSESDKYDDLEKYADAIVYVPPNSKKAIITSAPKSSLMIRRSLEKSMALKGLMCISLDIHIDLRILFNDYFYDCYLASTLSKIEINSFFEDNYNEYQTFHLISCGYPIWSNSWLVDNSGRLFKTTSSNKSTVEWVEIDPPLTHLPKSKEQYSQLVAGQDSTCWVVFCDQIFIYQPFSSKQWRQIDSPSEFGIQSLSLYSSKELVWALDYKGKVYSWTPEYEHWKNSPHAPKLKSISVGKNEVWGVSEENQVYRRIIMRESGGEGERWILLHGALLSHIAVVNANEVWGLDPDGNAYVWSSTIKLNASRNAENIALLNYSRESISIQKNRMYNMCWQMIGNTVPLRKISVCSSGAVWGVSDNHTHVYKLSKHRLLVTSISSSRKVWDDRKINGTFYHIGFWRPLPPPGYHVLGHIAERSHLENSSTEAVVVQEVGYTKGDIRILVHPIAYRRLWSASSKYGECSIWRPVPPSSDYIAMGDIAVPNLRAEQPDPEMVVCIHKNFVKSTKAYHIPGKDGYLWSSKGAIKTPNYWSVWLVEPSLDSILCNTFITGDGEKPPHSKAYCLKLNM